MLISGRPGRFPKGQFPKIPLVPQVMSLDPTSSSTHSTRNLQEEMGKLMLSRLKQTKGTTRMYFLEYFLYRGVGSLLPFGV